MKKQGNVISKGGKHGKKQTTIDINIDEVNALNEAINYYLQKHKPHDPNDNIIKKLIELDKDIHDLGNDLSPE